MVIIDTECLVINVSLVLRPRNLSRNRLIIQDYTFEEKYIAWMLLPLLNARKCKAYNLYTMINYGKV